MTRAEYENLRSMRLLRDRDPVEAALFAIACLDQSGRVQLQSRFNETFAGRVNPTALRFEEGAA